jgi:hypothetical protein
MSYAKHSEARHFDPPEDMKVETVGDGLLVFATPEIFSDAKPEHVKAANRLNETLASVRDAENDFASQPDSLRTSSIR